MPDGRIHLSSRTEETQPRTPGESLVLAWAGIAPIAVAAVAEFILPGNASALVARIAVVWAGAILCFLAGVRRGLSFRQPGGPLLSQLATMLWLFVLGFVSLVVPLAKVSLILQILGYATLAILDPLAASRGESPIFFERLRPVQMTVAVASLALLLAGQFLSPR